MDRKNKTISESLTLEDGSNIKILHAPTLRRYPSNGHLYYDGFLSSLRITAFISSLGEMQIPAIEPEVSRAQRYQATQDLLWKGPHKAIEILLKEGDGDWIAIAKLSLLNTRPFQVSDALPYLSAEGDFLLGEKAWLGIAVTDDNYGLLGENDRLNIYGCLLLEAPELEPQPFTDCTSHRWQVNDSTLLLPANSNRRQAILCNADDAPVWVAFAETASLDEGLFLRPGDRYEIGPSNLYQGPLAAIAPLGQVLMTGIECQ